MAGFWSDLLREMEEHISIVLLGFLALIIGFLGSIPDAIRFVLGNDFPIPSWLGLLILSIVVGGFLVYFGYFLIKYYGHKNPVKNVITSLTYKDIEYAIDELSKIIGARHGFLIEAGPGDVQFDREKNLIIGIDRGGAIVGGLIAKKLKIPFTTISIKYAKNSPLGNKGYKTAIDASKNFNNIDFTDVKRIILIDDAVRTGTNMSAAKTALDDYLAHQGISLNNDDIKTACILKVLPPAHRPGLVEPNFFVFKTEISRLTLPWDTLPDN